MSTEGSKLWVILAKLSKPNITLPEIKENYFEAKNLVESIVPDDSDVRTSIQIFNKGGKLIDKFFHKWQSGQIKPTDEDLDLLEEAFKEASLAYDFLAINHSSFFSSDNNKVAQQKLKKVGKIVAEEKQRRQNPNSPNQPSQTNNSNNLFSKENVFFF